mmetsp:Transcript_14997/g.27198  ORF Transcript_14997/g.27198 Transcript_14997/m.27198 type:complete len:528 (-) Transcript_14997:2038-3621(-)
MEGATDTPSNGKSDVKKDLPSSLPNKVVTKVTKVAKVKKAGVSFDKSVKPAETKKQSKATHVGKANMKRDLSVLAGVILFFVILSLTVYRDSGVGVDDNPIKSLQEALDILAKVELKKMREIKAGRDSTVCGMYLAGSSIPGVSLGVYVVRDFPEGEVVLQDGPEPAILRHIEAGSSDLPEHSSLSMYEVLINHHPLKSVQRGQDGKFRALRHVIPGQELFMDFENHPHRSLGSITHIFDNIPVDSDYEEADEIIKESFKIKGGHKPKGRAVFTSKRRAIHHGTPAINLLKKTVTKFHARIGSLLPAELMALQISFGRGVIQGSLTNRTMYQIEKEGACLDSVHVGDSLIENGGKGIFATRAIKKGQIILPAPLYALNKQSSTISKDVVVNQCFGHDDSDLLLCPLSLVAFMNHGASSSKTCSVDECVNGANADYEWSRWNKINLDVDSLSVDDIIQKHNLAISFDMFATRDIAVGEEILLDYGSNWATAWDEYNVKKKKSLTPLLHAIDIKDEVFPSAWKNVAKMD